MYVRITCLYPEISICADVALSALHVDVVTRAFLPFESSNLTLDTCTGIGATTL